MRFGTWRVGTRGRCWGRGWTGAGRGDPSAERYINNDNGDYSDDDNEDDDCDDDDDNGQYHDDNAVHDEHECNDVDDYTEDHEHDDNDNEDREADSAEDHDHGCSDEHHDEERGHECVDDDDDNYEDIDDDDGDDNRDDDDDGEGLASAGKEDFEATVPTHPLRKLTPDQVEQVERATRGQSDNEAWFAWRRGRITASVAHSIAHCRYVSGHSDRVPESYLRSLLPSAAAATAAAKNLRTPALLWGRDMEATAVELYRQKKQRQMNDRYVVRVSPCGLYVDAERPWLAASPDGLVTLEPVAPSAGDLDPSSPSPRSPPSPPQRLLLEVKCPYKHRAGSVRKAWASDRKFCLDVVEQGGRTSYELKREHSYYTQVQCQLAVSRLLLADFVVYTEEDLAIAPVPFDADFWNQTLERLSTFYDKAVRPLLRPTRPPVEE